MGIKWPFVVRFVLIFVSSNWIRRYGIQSPSAKPFGLFLVAWISASKWMSDFSALSIMPSGSIVTGCKYTAAISMLLSMCGLPIGYSAARAKEDRLVNNAAVRTSRNVEVIGQMRKRSKIIMRIILSFEKV